MASPLNPNYLKKEKELRSQFFRYIYKYIYVYTDITIYVVLSIHIHFSGRRTRTAARRQSFVRRGAERRLFAPFWQVGPHFQTNTPVSFEASTRGYSYQRPHRKSEPKARYAAFWVLCMRRAHMISVMSWLCLRDKTLQIFVRALRRPCEGHSVPTAYASSEHALKAWEICSIYQSGHNRQGVVII